MITLYFMGTFYMLLAQGSKTMSNAQLSQIPILCALFLAITNSSWADSPSSMILWKKERDAFMEMNCSPISEIEIECKSITTMLLKTDDDKTIEEKLTSSGVPNYFNDDGTIKEERLAQFSFCNGPEMEYLLREASWVAA